MASRKSKNSADALEQAAKTPKVEPASDTKREPKSEAPPAEDKFNKAYYFGA